MRLALRLYNRPQNDVKPNHSCSRYIIGLRCACALSRRRSCVFDDLQYGAAAFAEPVSRDLIALFRCRDWIVGCRFFRCRQRAGEFHGTSRRFVCDVGAGGLDGQACNWPRCAKPARTLCRDGRAFSRRDPCGARGVFLRTSPRVFPIRGFDRCDGSIRRASNNKGCVFV